MGRILTRLLRIRTQRLPGRRYRTDRWATVVAVILVVLAIPVAVVMSAASYGAETAAAREKAATSYETVAVLQEDAVAPDAPGTYGLPVEVPATWRTPDGIEHEGQISVQPQLAAGTEVAVWVDADGQLTAAPRSQTEITTTVIATGVWNLALMELAILGVYRFVLWLIDRARFASWGAEWAEVDPRWSQRQ